MILKIVEIPHALNSTHIGYNAQLSFINGVETIQEIPKLERLRRLQSYEALLDSCNISNMVMKWWG